MTRAGEKHKLHVAEPVLGAQVGVLTVRTHREEDCGGPMLPNGRPACSIHNPSDHHMVTWPLNWRMDTRVMERFCPHGIGHPDPDHLAFVAYTGTDNGDGIHGCDGCCRAPGPIMSAAQVGERLGIAKRTVLRYLWESQGNERRYSDHPFPAPKGRVGRAPYWLVEQVPELDAWFNGRKGQGAGGGPKKKI